MVLLHAFLEIKNRHKINFAVAHVHHGSNAESVTRKFRSKAKQLVKDFCQQNGIVFFTNEVAAEIQLISEAALRRYRYEYLKGILRSEGYDYMVIAHHQQDLLETRLIRLIRGTGLQGLPAMQEWSGALFRPFLDLKKCELEAYAQFRDILFCEDPSNRELTSLRNWLRHHWLRDLEGKRAGSVSTLGRSLEGIATELSLIQNPGPKSKAERLHKIDRAMLQSLSKSEQQRLLAQFLHERGSTNYSRSQIDEVLKRLNTKRKQFQFSLMKELWLVTAKYISLDESRARS